ncbi:MAG: hypothetical protein ACKPKO_13590, partial [Candidatus Fonsibacter sp.]
GRLFGSIIKGSSGDTSAFYPTVGGGAFGIDPELVVDSLSLPPVVAALSPKAKPKSPLAQITTSSPSHVIAAVDVPEQASASAVTTAEEEELAFLRKGPPKVLKLPDSDIPRLPGEDDQAYKCRANRLRYVGVTGVSFAEDELIASSNRYS